ncbi:hypothetical protein GF318_04830 [Candidatus Micrarchaeota archaeon]|nr:hypothetical protein [Candidatus Micrarchaeota archaeon]
MKRKLSYSLARRAPPFLKGLNHMQPLVEVARRGLCGNYSLKPGQRKAYASRITENCSFSQICSMLEKAQSGESQEALAKLARGSIMAELRHIYSLLPQPWEEAQVETLRKFMTVRAERFMDMREQVCEILAAGTVTSEKARSKLLSTLLHSNLMDGFCNQEEKRQALIRSLKECGAITEKESGEVGYRARKSGQVLFFS